MSKNGRPEFEYTPELGAEICETIATSTVGLRKLCQQNVHWPRKTTIFKWRILHPSFAEAYARAKQLQIEALIDDVIDISDNDENDLLEGEDGKLRTNHQEINRARLRIDTRKWLASKLVPRLYGDSKTKDSEQDAISQFRVENE